MELKTDVFVESIDRDTLGGAKFVRMACKCVLWI